MDCTRITKLESETIDLLRFPMIIGVLLIHSGLGDVVINGHVLIDQSEFPFFAHFHYLFSEIIARLAVPLFFFISGFLFFLNPVKDINSWKKKINKRIHSLFIPYMVWNLIYVLFYFGGEHVVPQLFSGRNQMLSESSFLDILSCFWCHHENMPIDYPLWFIRDLMVVNIFSYFIYKLIKRFKFYFIAILGCIWYFHLNLHLPVGVSAVAFFFFSFGAYFSIFKYNFLEKIKPLMIPSIVLYIINIIVLLTFCFTECTWTHYVHDLGILVGMVVLFTIAQYGIERFNLKSNKFLANSTFFIFAYHAIPLALVIKLACKYLSNYSDLSLIAIYLGCPIIVAILGLILYYLIETYLKSISRILTGGR